MLLIMLLLQAQMALAGCLAQAPDAQPAALMDAMADCHSTDTGLARTCLRHCEQAAESPTSSLDRSAGVLFDLPLMQHAADIPYPIATGTSTLHRNDPPHAIGPPVYLRLSRLLD